MAAIRLHQIHKRFQRTEVLRDMSLDIPDGEFVVFVGPSGCGKSTLLRMIAGLEDVSAGAIHFDGEDVTDTAPKARGVAMVFQSYALYPHMSVYDNLAFGLKLAKTQRQSIRERVESVARTLQIEHLLQRKPRELSGGQRQRVAIGRAIVRQPRVFLFDEPLSNLDAALRVQMRLELQRLHRDLGATMIYVTHDQVEAMTLADRIVILNGGRIEQVGTPRELYQRPANRFVAGFIGSPGMNFLAGTVTDSPGDDTEIRLDAGHPPLRIPPLNTPTGAAVTVGIRPEHVHGPAQDGDCALHGTVISLEHLGNETHVYVDCDQDQPLVFIDHPTTTIEPGQVITIGLSAADCLVFDTDGQRVPPAATSGP